MLVTVADHIPAFADIDDPFGEVVRSRGGQVRYLDCASESEVIEECADADVMIISKAPITPRVAGELSASLVIRVGTGFDNVDVQAATDAGIMVANTPGYSRHQVATTAMTMALAASRELVHADRALRAEEGWGVRRNNQQIHGATLGIVGLGRIGRSVVPKARGFDMEVIAHDPYVPRDVFDHLDVESVGFEDLLARSDVVSVHTPLTSETHHLFSTAEFERMRDDAVFVNVSRGPIVDGDALLAAVESGEIWGAGLDVFEVEPPNDLALFRCDRIVVSPHRAGQTDESHERKLRIAREVLADGLDGRVPESLVNPWVRWYSGEQLNPEFHEWRDGSPEE